MRLWSTYLEPSSLSERRKMLAWIAKFRPEPGNNVLQTAGFGNTAPAVGAGVQQSKKTIFDCSPTGC
jgi:hypothetical protein